MKEENGYKCFETIRDLKEHIEDVVTFTYEEGDKEVVYMKKLTNVSKEYYGGKILKDDDTIPQGLMTYGINMVVIKSSFPHMITPRILYVGDREQMSNRFEIIRMPTKEEMNIYRNMLRRYRIFGTKN